VTDHLQASRGEPRASLRAASSTKGSPADPIVGAGSRPWLTSPESVPAPARSWVGQYRRNAVLLDAVAGIAGASFAYAVRFGTAPEASYAWSLLLAPLMWIMAVLFTGGYEMRYAGVSSEEYRSLVRASACAVVVVSVAAYSSQQAIARGYVVMALPSALLISLLLRRGLRLRLARARAQGRHLQRTVVVGRRDSVAAMIRQIQRAPNHGMQVVGACVSGRSEDSESPSHVEGVPVFGLTDGTVAAVDLLDAEVVAVSSHPDLAGHALRRLAWSLEERQVELLVSPGILEVAGPRLSIRPTAGMPLLHVERPVTSGGRRVVKSSVDKLLAVALTILALPVLAVIALLVRLDSPGPILFRQNRVGAQGVEFSMLKFRTMVVDAEKRLADLTTGHAVNSMMFKLKDDPRVTRVGAFLRRYSLDELPQLFNVLAGTMSLVGPRPPLPREVALYEPDAVRRLRVRPGLTGLWQVSGRSNLTWDESLRLDLWYVDNWSLVLDLQILFRTLRAVLRGAGAY
jgi:exopolysaccharide biosynthesis polyprenyl glycosylphosphotransferase